MEGEGRSQSPPSITIIETTINASGSLSSSAPPSSPTSSTIDTSTSPSVQTRKSYGRTLLGKVVDGVSGSSRSLLFSSSNNEQAPPVLSKTTAEGIHSIEKVMEKRKSKTIQAPAARLTEYKKINRRPRNQTIDIEKTSLIDLLPRCVNDFLSVKTNQSLQTPITQRLQCASLFLDISQFTVISELFSLNSKLRGPETLAQYVNQLFTQIVRLVSKSGGDIFKFAGDAMIVLWVADNEAGLGEAALRAAACAWDIQDTIPKLELADGLALRLKIGIGAGSAILVHVGLDLTSQNLGQNNRLDNTAAKIDAKNSNDDMAASAAAATTSTINENTETTAEEQVVISKALSNNDVSARVNGALVQTLKRNAAESVDVGSTMPSRLIRSRREYLVMGDPLRQCFAAEHSATTGDIIASPEAWEFIKVNFSSKSKPIHGGFMKIEKQEVPVKKKKVERAPAAPKELLLSYIPRSAHLFLEVEDDTKKDWVSELRRVTVLFVNIGITKNDIADIIATGGKLQKLQDCFCAVQRAVIDYEGSVNKFLIDDKGSTLVAVFGLPPISHENDAIRGVLCGLALSAALQKLGVDPAVGIATGTAFCGVVGHPGGRREYTVLGDIVNLSARLMQRATRKNDGVLVDSETKYQSQSTLEFRFVKQIKVKGKSELITVYQPHPSDRKRRNIIQRVLNIRKHRRRSLDGDLVKQVANVSNVEHRSKFFMFQTDFLKTKEKLLDEKSAPQGDNVNALIARMKSYILDTSEMGPYSILLEGSIGIGKSYAISLLSTLLTESHVRVYMAVGNPFERGALARPFGAYSQLINQAIAHQYEINTGGVMKSKKSMAAPSSSSSPNSLKKNDFEDVDDEYVEVPTLDRQAIVLKWLAIANSKTTKYAWLLNDDLFVNFPDKTTTEGVDVEEQNLLLMASKGDLIIDILKGITRDSRVCIMIDDAMYMDAASWSLTLQIAERGYSIEKGISVVIASRPIDEFVLIDATSRNSYKNYPSISSVKFERMKPMDSASVRELALKCLNVVNIPPVIELAIAKCQGNPLFVREMLQGMVRNKILEINKTLQVARVTTAAANTWQENDKSLSCTRCETRFTTFNRRHHCRSCGRLFCGNCAPSNYKLPVVGYDTPQRHCIECYEAPSARDYWIAKNLSTVILEPPVTIVCVMGTWIDKLSACQQMILKVASLIQRDMRFNKNEVFDAYPIVSHEDYLEEDFKELCRLGFIRLANVDASDENLQRFEFIHNFLPDVLSQRMLSSQRNELLLHVADMKENRDIATRKEFRETHEKEILNMILMQGYILLHRDGEKKNAWDRRWAAISGHKLDFFADKKGIKTLLSIELKDAKVSIETQEFENRLGAIRIDAKNYSRQDIKGKEAKTFYIAPESSDLELSKKWTYFIKFGIETGDAFDSQDKPLPKRTDSGDAAIDKTETIRSESSNANESQLKNENGQVDRKSKRDPSMVDMIFGLTRRNSRETEEEEEED